AGLGFDYFFLPPYGFGIEAPEHWVALTAFLITALATGQLAARAKQRQILAEQQEREMAMLYQLTNAFLESDGSEATLAELPHRVLTIFATEGVAIFDRKSGTTVRAGPQAGAISDLMMQEAANLACHIGGAGSPFSVTPIRHGGEVVGSVGIHGGALSVPLRDAIAGRIGLGLARLYAIERTTEAEVARRSEELKSAVLDALAHEIRSPLNSVKIAATTLLSGRPDGESDKREMLTIIDQEVDRMDHFIDEAVQLARMQADELSLRKEPQNMTGLLQAAIEGMGALTAHREVQVNVPESLPPAECDKSLVLRVLKQLLNNALKYSPEGSPLIVSAASTEAAIVIDVIDRGPGVREDERERIFEKYYRGRAARGRGPGSGLGLASAKCIVEAHGGRMWVTTPPGGGAAFHVSLP